MVRKSKKKKLSKETYNNRGKLKRELEKRELEKREETISDYDKTIKICEDYKKAYNNRGMSKIKLRKRKKATSDYNEVIEINEKEKREETISDYDKTIKICEDYKKAYNNRGMSKIKLRKRKKATSGYNEVIEINEKLKKAYNNRGELKRKLGEREEAILDFNEAIKIDKDCKEAYNNRGLSKFELGQKEEGIQDLSEAIKIDDKYKEAYNNRGKLKRELGKREEAILDFNKAIKIDNKYKEAYNNRGELKRELGKREEAILDFNKAIKIDDKYKEAYNNRGELKRELGKKEEAILDFNKAIKIDGKYKEAYNNRGVLKRELGKKEEAIRDFNKAIKIDDKYKEAYNNRGVLKFELRKREEAILDFMKAIDELKSKLYLTEIINNLNKATSKYFTEEKNIEKKISLINSYIEKKLYFNIKLLGCIEENIQKNQNEIKDKLKLSFKKNIKTHLLEKSEKFCEKIFYTYKEINKNTIESLVKKGVYKNDSSNFNDPFDPYFKINKTIFYKELLNIKITCFSETGKNLLLWAHYGNNHKGVCLGYKFKRNKDVKNICFNKIIYNEIKTEKVKPKEELKDKILKVNNMKIEEEGLTIADTYFRKHQDWSYENEYRMLHLNTEEDTEKHFTGLELKEVIFGMETTDEDKKLIKEIVNGIYKKDKNKENKNEEDEVMFYEMEQGPNLTVEKK
ncbi:MAG: tetratricopeptide repeat protein [Fusobacteriaceae bacterium]